MTLPDDFARCLNDKCPKEDTCARRKTLERPKGLMRRVYADFQPDKNGECDYYIPVREKKKATIV